MPAKAPIDENVKFLFACLFRSDYKTIDFARVAADFSINPAAARMRWSRLKKTINQDDIASSVISSPTKTKSPSKQKKEYKELEEANEDPDDAPMQKRTERKAKLRAGQKIGMVVKMQEEDSEEAEGTEAEDKDLGDPENKNDEGQREIEQDDTKPVIIKTEKEDNSESKPATQKTQPTFGLFHLSPSIPAAPLPDHIPTSALSVIVPVRELGDETETEALGTTTTIKSEPGSNTRFTISPKSPGSPASSFSSFHPDTSARTSASPTPSKKQLERSPQKRRAGAGNSPRAQKSRNRARKIVDDEDEEEEL